ncbi:MAG: SpoIIE family protein phosphatase [Gammaproteobacteria bacterium]|jgi:serine phosphatase RsbU (regulator of sigma subunit)
MTVDKVLEYSSRIRPCFGESVSGDTVVIRTLGQSLFVAIVDVLGHGPEAHELTHVIETYLGRYGNADVSGVMTRLHQHLKGTRGAAVGLCAFDESTGCIEYVGVGNTAIRRMGKAETRLVSKDGVVGQSMRSLLPQTMQLEAGDLIILHTDGVSGRFTVEDYPGASHHSPEEVARNIVKRYGKDHDDAACIAVRYRG